MHRVGEFKPVGRAIGGEEVRRKAPQEHNQRHAAECAEQREGPVVFQFL